jgi:hypothetical protein
MPYNVGMTELTLVLPFSLPPAELAADLVRALEAPHLAAVLTRSASYQRKSTPGATRSLPHENWLARHVGLQGDGLPFAAAVMRAYGLDAGSSSWLMVQPAHIEIARTHLLMRDARRLGLVESHARALYDSARPYFDEIGHTLVYGDAGTWFMRAGDWAALDTASPDSTGGMNLLDAMPQGAAALAYRKLQNEVQMLWHAHPANAEREARGLASINGFWPWGGSSAAQLPTAQIDSANAPSWLAALGTVVHGPFAQWPASAKRASSFVEASLIGPALATDWADWLQQMKRIDADVLAPALAAVKGGQPLRLVLSHRADLVEARVTALSQRSFWRRHSLDRLLA